MPKYIHLVCASCDGVQRIDMRDRNREPRCSTCRRVIFEGRCTEINEEQFWRQMERSDVPLLVALSRCDPDQKGLSEILNKAAPFVEPMGRIFMIDVETHSAIARRFEIDKLPATVVFHRGRAVTRIADGADAAAMIEAILAITAEEKV